MIQKYFTDKLNKVKQQIEASSAYIIKKVTEGDTGDLTKTAEALMMHRDTLSSLTKDAVEYCTVSQIIAIGEELDYSKNKLNLLSKRDLVYAYKYKQRAITTTERDQLVDAFGYELKEAKV